MPTSFDDAAPKALTGQLANIKKQEMGEREARLGNMEDAWSRWEGRMAEAFKRESASREDLKPWNAELEQAKHQTNVWEAFGSPGFLVAMLGSAFAAMPMNAALQAGGAAIEAKNRNDKEGYDRAFEAWQQNTELAIKRHAMEHEELDDIYKISSKDMEMGLARLKEHMLKYDDQRGLALLEAGMLPEYWQAKESEARAYEDIAKAKLEVIKSKAIQDEVAELQKKPGYEGPGGQFRALTETLHKMKEAETVRYGYGAHPTKEGMIYEIARGYKELRKAEGAEVSDEEADLYARRKVAEAGKTASPTETKEKSIARIRDEYKKKMEAAGTPVTEEQADRYARRQVAESGAVISGNRRADLQAHEEQYNLALDDTIPQAEAILRKHTGVAGAAGYVTRTAETVGNLLGSNETDRREFESLISDLRLRATNLLLDRTGRPISTEHALVDKIIRGLNLGDTTANTLRSLEDLRARLTKLRGALRNRLDETGDADPPAADKPAPAPSTDKWWEDYPEAPR